MEFQIGDWVRIDNFVRDIVWDDDKSEFDYIFQSETYIIEMVPTIGRVGCITDIKEYPEEGSRIATVDRADPRPLTGGSWSYDLSDLCRVTEHEYFRQQERDVVRQRAYEEQQRLLASLPD